MRPIFASLDKLQNSANIAILGDSTSYQNTYGIALNLRAIGYMTWATILSDRKLNFNNTLNFGVPGDTTAMMLARLNAAIGIMKSNNVNFCVVKGGTNDVTAATGSDQTSFYNTTISNIKKICATLISNEITPVVLPITARSATISATQMLLLQRINNWIREYAATTRDVLICDATLHIIDQNTDNNSYPIGATTGSVTATTYDGLHESVRGAFYVGRELVNTILPYVGGFGRKCIALADSYDATNNPNGNCLSNVMMKGTGGTPLGSNVSGNIADSFTAQHQSGTTGTMVCSKSTVSYDNTNTAPAQVLTCSSAAGSASEVFKFYQQIFSKIAVGDNIYAECRFSISGIGADSFKYIKLSLTDGVNTSVIGIQDVQYMPNESFTGTMRTPIMTAAAANFGSPVLEWALDGTVGGAAVVITIEYFTLKKVVTV
jgi:lysophospholipase L1-like esterase